MQTLRSILCCVAIISQVRCAQARQIFRTIDPPGPEVSAGFGFSMSGVPDLDGDGAGDVIISAPWENTPGGADISGVVYVYSGRTAAYIRTLYSPSPVGYGYFGDSVAGIADLDGDGRGDIIIGAPGEGRVYVYSGATGVLIRTLQSPNSGATFGAGVAPVPDADGDGVPDILVGAPGEYNERGRAYLFSGATGQLLYTFVSPFPRPNGGGCFGSVAGVPDADDDGFGDVLIGAPCESTPGYPDARGGRAYLFSGHTGQLLRTIDSPTQPAVCFGLVLAGAPDLDGDGRGDLIICDPGQVVPGNPITGSVMYVFSGATGQFLYMRSSPMHQGGFGAFSVAALPDLDGDGRAEILVGDPLESVSGQPAESGVVYILSGATGSILRAIPCPQPTPRPFPDLFGINVAVLPDASGDGRPDLLIRGGGCHTPPCPPHPYGRAYIYLSCASDFNYSGAVNSQDFFDFLAAFFAGSPAADFNHDGSVNTQDFFAFLTAFFDGC